MKGFKEIGFWIAVGLAGAVTVGLLKIIAARFPLPSGLEEAIAAL